MIVNRQVDSFCLFDKFVIVLFFVEHLEASVDSFHKSVDFHYLSYS